MRTPAVVVAGLCFALCGCSSFDREVALDDVPAAVIQAAEAAMEGFAVTEAEVEEEDGVRVYELEGTAQGMEFEIEVTAQGEVVEIEQDT